MPTFSPNIAKTAKANITVKPVGLSYKCELYLVKDTTKYNTSGLISFTSTGAAQPASFPITMPSAGGTYKVWLDVFADSTLIGAFEAVGKVTIEAPVGTVYGCVYYWKYATADSFQFKTAKPLLNAKLTVSGMGVIPLDAQGCYEITLDAGTWDFRCEALGYMTVLWPIEVIANERKLASFYLDPL